MTVNDSRTYLAHMNLVDEYNNTHNCSIGKKPIDVDYSFFSNEFEPSHKSPNLEFVRE